MQAQNDASAARVPSRPGGLDSHPWPGGAVPGFRLQGPAPGRRRTRMAPDPGSQRQCPGPARTRRTAAADPTFKSAAAGVLGPVSGPRLSRAGGPGHSPGRDSDSGGCRRPSRAFRPGGPAGLEIMVQISVSVDLGVSPAPDSDISRHADPGPSGRDPGPWPRHSSDRCDSDRDTLIM